MKTGANLLRAVDRGHGCNGCDALAIRTRTVQLTDNSGYLRRIQPISLNQPRRFSFSGLGASSEFAVK